jgi:hypothetical protein
MIKEKLDAYLSKFWQTLPGTEIHFVFAVLNTQGENFIVRFTILFFVVYFSRNAP